MAVVSRTAGILAGSSNTSLISALHRRSQTFEKGGSVRKDIVYHSLDFKGGANRRAIVGGSRTERRDRRECSGTYHCWCKVSPTRSISLMAPTPLITHVTNKIVARAALYKVLTQLYRPAAELSIQKGTKHVGPPS